MASPVAGSEYSCSPSQQGPATTKSCMNEAMPTSATFIWHLSGRCYCEPRRGVQTFGRAQYLKATIDLSGVRPDLNGRLIYQGKGIDKKSLVFADNKHAIYGQDVYRVTMNGMHMTRKDHTVSQGLVVETAPGNTGDCPANWHRRGRPRRQRMRLLAPLASVCSGSERLAALPPRAANVSGACFHSNIFPSVLCP